MERKNLIFAKNLVRIARELLAGNERHGHYSFENGSDGSLVVYFILNNDAVESKAFENANVCRYEISKKLDKLEGSFDITRMENNDHKSFCFSIIKEDGKDGDKKASVQSPRTMTADGDDGGSPLDLGGGGDAGGGDDGGMPLDLGGGDDSPDGEDKPKEPAPPKKDDETTKKIKEIVKDVCKKHGWDAES